MFSFILVSLPFLNFTSHQEDFCFCLEECYCGSWIEFGMITIERIGGHILLRRWLILDLSGLGMLFEEYIRLLFNHGSAESLFSTWK